MRGALVADAVGIDAAAMDAQRPADVDHQLRTGETRHEASGIAGPSCSAVTAGGEAEQYQCDEPRWVAPLHGQTPLWPFLDGHSAVPAQRSTDGLRAVFATSLAEGVAG
jgi:hypothetical protein